MRYPWPKYEQARHIFNKMIPFAVFIFFFICFIQNIEAGRALCIFETHLVDKIVLPTSDYFPYKFRRKER